MVMASGSSAPGATTSSASSTVCRAAHAISRRLQVGPPMTALPSSSATSTGAKATPGVGGASATTGVPGDGGRPRPRRPPSQARRPYSASSLQRLEAEQLRRVVPQDRRHVLRRDAEADQGADEDPQPVDGVHVEDLPEVAAGDAALGADRADRVDGLERIADGLVERGNHRLAIGADVRAEVGELAHLVDEQLVQLEQRMVEQRLHAQLVGKRAERQQLLEVRVAETAEHVRLRSQLEDGANLREHGAAVVDEPDVALAVLDSGEAGPPVRLEGRKPEDPAVRILERDLDRLGVDPVVEAEPAVDLDAVLEPAVAHELVDVALDEVGRARRQVPVILVTDGPHVRLRRR